MYSISKPNGLPVGEVKPLKKFLSENSLVESSTSDLGYSRHFSIDMEECSLTDSLSVSCELPIMIDSTDDEEVNVGDVELQHMTLPHSGKAAIEEAQSRIPRPRHLKSTFLPIPKSRSTNNTPRQRHAGTPLQELDRKWALEECENLTTWTRELLQSRGKRLDKDLRKAISDGFTLPAIMEIVFGCKLNTLHEDIDLSQDERLEVLADCLLYLKNNSFQLPDISAQDLVGGDLKAILTVLAAIKEAMGQNKSKQTKKHPDQTKLIHRENGHRDYAPSIALLDSQTSVGQENVLITPKTNNTQDRSPRKVLKTFQSSLRDSSGPTNERSVKGTLKTSLSLDALDDQKPTTIILGRSKSHDRHQLGKRSASNVSINVDSGEQEFDDDEDYKMVPAIRSEPAQQHQFKSLSMDTRSSGLSLRGSNQQSKPSAFSYLSNRGRSRKERSELDHTRLSYQALLVRGQPSGESNPSTPSVRDSTGKSINVGDSVTSQKLTLAPVFAQPYLQQPRAVHRNKEHKNQTQASKEENAVNGNSQSNEGSTSSDKSASDQQSRKASGRARRRSSRQRTKLSSERSSNNTTPNDNPKDHQEDSSLANGGPQSKAIESYARSPRRYTSPKNRLKATPADHRPHRREKVVKNEAIKDSKVSSTPPTPPARLLTQPNTSAQSTETSFQPITQEVNAPVHKVHQSPPPDVPKEEEKVKAPSPYRELTEAQLRRLSMPTGLEYKKTESKSSKRAANDVAADEHQEELWGAHVDMSLDDSFIHNADTRNVTPTLPALTDNTDIESVSDVLHNRRYKRSASVSDRMLFTTGEFRKDSQGSDNTVQASQQPDKESKSTDDKDETSTEERRKRRGVTRKSSGQSHRKSDRQRKPPRPNKPPSPESECLPQTERPLDEKVDKLEKLFEQFAEYLGTERPVKGSSSKRHSLTESASSQRSVSRSTRTYRHTSKADSRTNKRIQTLESHMMTLAKSVSHLSSEMRTYKAALSDIDKLTADGRHNKVEIERLTAEVSALEQVASSRDNSNNHIGSLSSPRELEGVEKVTSLSAESKDRATKINKLTKFFGQQPPMMKMFLKDLGYGQYTSKFEKEHIGVLELPYVSEDQLKSIGIPLGPRLRILHEAKDIQSFRKKK